MKLAVCLMFVLGILFPLSLSEYLFVGEANVESEEFDALGSHYEIVSIEGVESLLIKNEQIVEDQSEIEDALQEYYVKHYYPSTPQINNISSILALYHESRENGDMWTNVEEEECRMALFLDAGLFSCTNDSEVRPTTWAEARGNDCYMLASVICEEYGEYLGCSDPWDILPLVKDFAFSSNGMNEIDNRTTTNLASVTEDNIYDVFLQLQEDIDSMKEYEEKLENTIFRVPIGGAEECGTCLGICPPIIISEEYLESAEEQVDELLPQMEYIGEYKQVAAGIYASTMERKGYYSVNLLRAYYASLFSPEKQRAIELIADADEVLELVSDDKVLSNSQRAGELLLEIGGKLNDSDFGIINTSRSELNAKLNVLEEEIAFSWEVYENASEAKEIADSLFFTLETKSLSDEDLAEFSFLKSEKRTQDRSFVDGLSPEKYLQMTEKYLELSAGASEMLQRGETTEVVVDTFKGAGMKTNSGLSDLVTTMIPLQRTEREELSGYAPLLVSSLSFFSLSSLAIFLLVFVSAIFAGIFRNKLVLLGGILILGCSLLFAGIISGGIFFVLSSSSTDASFTDFQSSVLSSSQVSIMVNSNEAPAGAASSMMECAQELASELEGREVIIYEKLDGSCLINNSITLAECYNTIDEPIIVLAYSTEGEVPQFSTGFVYKGTFYGDEEYFSQCQLAKGFLQTEPVPPPSPGSEDGGTSGGEEPAGAETNETT